METLNRFFAVSIVVMGALSAGCGRPNLEMPEEVSFGSEGQAPTFDLLVSNIFAPKCATCHSNYTTYNGIMASGAVVAMFADQSKLYLRVANGSMPLSASPLNETEIKAIADWINAGALNTQVPGGSPSPAPSPLPSPSPAPAPSPTPPPTNIEPTYAWLQTNVFTPRCTACHQGAAASGGYDLTTYLNVITRVNAATPLTSVLFQRIDNNSMPPGGPALSSEVKAAVLTWIQNGAKNDGVAGTPPPPPPPLPPLEPKFKSIYANIIGPRCTACHGGTRPADGINLTTYSGVMNEVTPRNPTASALYESVNENDMPKGGPYLNATEKQTLRQWILDGALNN